MMMVSKIYKIAYRCGMWKWHVHIYEERRKDYMGGANIFQSMLDNYSFACVYYNINGQ